MTTIDSKEYEVTRLRTFQLKLAETAACVMKNIILLEWQQDPSSMLRSADGKDLEGTFLISKSLLFRLTLAPPRSSFIYGFYPKHSWTGPRHRSLDRMRFRHNDFSPLCLPLRSPPPYRCGVSCSFCCGGRFSPAGLRRNVSRRHTEPNRRQESWRLGESCDDILRAVQCHRDRLNLGRSAFARVGKWTWSWCR